MAKKHNKPNNKELRVLPKYKIPAKPGSAVAFSAHAAKTTVAPYWELPKVWITGKALAKIGAWVDMAEGEVTWYCAVIKEQYDYVIEDAFLTHQKVSAGSIDVAAPGTAALARELLADPNYGDEWIAKIQCWGHSHVKMGTTPSATDMDQFADLIKDCRSFYIRMIANKHGRLEMTLYEYDVNLLYTDVQWTLLPCEVDMDYLTAEFAEKVKPLVTTSYTPGSNHAASCNKKGSSTDTKLGSGTESSVSPALKTAREIAEQRDAKSTATTAQPVKVPGSSSSGGVADVLDPHVIRAILAQPESIQEKTPGAAKSSVPLVSDGTDSESVTDVIENQKKSSVTSTPVR